MTKNKFSILIWKEVYFGETEAVVQRCSVRKVLLETSQNSQENICARASFLIKKTLAQVFSCEFCEISENTFFYRTLLAAVFWESPASRKSSYSFLMTSVVLSIKLYLTQDFPGLALENYKC